MDGDGNLRLYSFDPNDREWIITWMALAVQCRVHGLCGLYALCIYTLQPTCVCTPGFTMADSTDWFKGCWAIKQLSYNPNTTRFKRLRYIDYYGFDNGYGTSRSLEACRKSCLDDCDCLGFGYRITGTGHRYLKFLLVNGYHLLEVINDIYVKISSSSIRARPCQAHPYIAQTKHSHKRMFLPRVRRETRSKLIVPLASFASTVGFTEIVCIALRWSVLNCQGG